MKTATRITLAGAAALAAVGGMGATAYAVSGGEDLFKSPETLAVEEQNRSDAEQLLTDQGSAISDLQTQIAAAEVALAQAQADYAAMLANASLTQNGTNLITGNSAGSSTSGAQTQQSPSANPTASPTPRYRDDADNQHDGHDDNDTEDHDDD
jgi:hypothetical protein